MSFEPCTRLKVRTTGLSWALWATAVAAHANFVVSANTTDFPPNVAEPADHPRHVYFGICYIEPAEFLNLVWADDPSDVAPEPTE
jgi:hypothetical protein